MSNAYPKAEQFKQCNETDVEQAQELITIVRELRSEMNISPAKELRCNLVGSSVDNFPFLTHTKEYIVKLAKLESLSVAPESTNTLTVTRLFGTNKVEFFMEELVNIDEEIAKLNKQVVKLESEIARVDGKLANEAFVSKAPAALIEQEKAKRVGFVESLTQVQSRIADLKAMKK